jgi:hypothetical protein
MTDNIKYFVHSPDEGFEFFATDEERRKEHDARIKRCKEEAYIGDGWPAETEDIVSGTVTHVTEATNIENRPAPCSEHPDEDPSLLSDCEACQAAAEWMHDADTKCDYEQAAASAAPQQASEQRAAVDDDERAAIDFYARNPSAAVVDLLKRMTPTQSAPVGLSAAEIVRIASTCLTVDFFTNVIGFDHQKFARELLAAHPVTKAASDGVKE